MAKFGFSYYKSDTDRFQDIKIKRLKKEFRCDGYAVYSYILNEIYRVQGCFLQWDECTMFDVAEYWGMKESLVGEIVKYCGAVGLFDKELLTNGRVITSKSIQSRYIEMCKLTKRKPVIPEEILLLSSENNTLSGENDKNSDILNETPSFSDNNKVKYSKENNIKEYPPYIPPQVGGTLEEGDNSIISLIKNDGVHRNFEGLMKQMERLCIPKDQQETILTLSNFGEIGHEVWKLTNQCEASLSKPKFDKSRIKLPGAFIISKLNHSKGEGSS